MNQLITDTQRTAQLATVSNEAARQTVFAQYQSQRSHNTLTRQLANLKLFADFLNQHGADVDAHELFSHAGAWKHVSFGLVEAFKLACVNEGRALSSINVYLSTIKSYAKLAYKSGVLNTDDYQAIKSIEGFSGRIATNVNAKREVTRISNEKVEALVIPTDIIRRVKAAEFYPGTPVGRRDRFIMCLLLDHALRASEAVNLAIQDVDTTTWQIKVYRLKTDSTDLISMSADTIKSFTAYMQVRLESMVTNPLIVTGRKGGKLNEPAEMHRVNLSNLVNRIGRKLAKQFNLPVLKKLSAHDLRHSWATHVANAGTPINIMMTAGGWSNPAMPIKYAVAGKIANEGVKLPY